MSALVLLSVPPSHNIAVCCSCVVVSGLVTRQVAFSICMAPYAFYSCADKAAPSQ